MNQEYKVPVEIEILEIRDLCLKVKDAKDREVFIAKSQISNLLDDEEYEDIKFHKECVILDVPLWLAEKAGLV